MGEKYRSWIPGVVFWILFVGSIAFYRRYPWLDAAWSAVWLLFLAVMAVHATLHIFRNRHETEGIVGYRGVPCWAVTLFGGEVDPPTRREVKSGR